MYLRENLTHRKEEGMVALGRAQEARWLFIVGGGRDTHYRQS